MRKYLVATAILTLGLSGVLAGCGTPSGPDRDGITRGPAPYGALTSAGEALKVVFDEVCLPTVLDGGDFVTLARSHYLVEDKPQKDSTGQTAQSFALASMARAGATFWSDGTCTVGLQKGDTIALREHILGALAARDQTMARGVSVPASGDGTRTAYCNSDPRPLILAIVEPASKKSKRPAVVANLYRAKGGASDICNR